MYLVIKKQFSTPAKLRVLLADFFTLQSFFFFVLSIPQSVVRLSFAFLFVFMIQHVYIVVASFFCTIYFKKALKEKTIFKITTERMYVYPTVITCGPC